LKLSTFFSKRTPLYVGVLVVLMLVVLFTMHKEESVKLLYAVNGSSYDASAYDNFQQSLEANLQLDKQDLNRLSLRQLKKYDAIYLDPSLHTAQGLVKARELQDYVRNGGHLFLENRFAGDFPPDFLGASELVKVPAPAEPKPQFQYPQADTNIEGVQNVFRLFSDNFFKHTDMSELPGFQWGMGIKPSTARTIVALDGVSISAINVYGKGTVFLSSAFLPNRYFITGYDLQSGMDPAQGFPTLQRLYNEHNHPGQGVVYFDKTKLKLGPFFHFAFAAANAQLRTEYVSFVSKEKLGYSVKKVLGPYGRPAMAFQHHFEAMPAIRDGVGIQWAELLKKYNEIPSYSLVRSTYEWGTWKESVSVQLNTGTSDVPQFYGQAPNSFYGSGTHLFSGGAAITQARYPDYRDLASPIDKPYRAYPAMLDLDGDGRADLLLGSADGYVYTYRNVGPPKQRNGTAEAVPAGAAEPDAFDKPQKLLLENGEPFRAPSYAAPAVFDASGDGKPDLLVGDGTGAVQLLAGRGDGTFAKPVALEAEGAPVRVPGPAAPAMGDIDGDGTPDLVVGDADGAVHLFRGIKGSPLHFRKDEVLFRIPARFAAPAIRDMNGDGKPDLVIGNNEGDLLVYIQEGGAWKAQGPLQGATLNQMGSKALVGGHNSVPLWYDINHDGKEDLIVGQLEFGVPYAIDDPQFPFKEQLKAFIDYAAKNRLELYPHLFFHNYYSSEQEQQEIALHKQAFQTLGIPWQMTGANQHTWRVNWNDRMQTFRNEQNQDIWFNFGFFMPNSPVRARPEDESLWGLPFLLQGSGANGAKPMLLYTPTPVLRFGANSTEDIFQSYVQLDMPINYFEHIEPFFPGNVAGLVEFAEYFDKLRTAYDYNFMSEPQMARSFLAALKGKVTVSRSWAAYLQDKLKDMLSGTEQGPHLSLTLRPDSSEVPAQAGGYKDTLGVVIEKGARLALYSLSTDSDFSIRQHEKLYVGLPKPAHVGIYRDSDRLHIVRSNVPTSIEKGADAWTIRLNEPGMQQIVIYSPQPIAIQGRDLKVDANEKARTYTVTHYGDPTSITVPLK
jgi:hypothetical protein